MNDPSAGNWLVDGGQMGQVIRSMDWSRSPLGPMAGWPQSLRTTVGLCLASNFPISLVWGPRHVQIYNDGYWPICGAKHPGSMGQDFTECWASAWPVIGEAFERARGGTTSFLEDQRMFLDRNGYLEETFFTFSFSPIRDESGGVGGLFHPVTETTGKMLAQRRTRALRDLAGQAGKAQSVVDALRLAAKTLGDYELDLPFALFYATDASGRTAKLVAQTGLRPDTVASPLEVDLDSADAVWPLAEIARSRQARQIDALEGRFEGLPCGPYPEPPKTAFAFPILLPGSERPAGFLVAGVSSRLPLSEGYRAFYDLAAAGVMTAAANARAYEEERKRAEALAEIDRAKTAFFSNVSHEFRTPLTLILGPLEDELAERNQPLPKARHDRLQAAHRNSLRLLKLVNTLLDFSRIEAGRVQARYEPADLATSTADLAAVFRAATEKAGLTLDVDCPPLAEPVYVDREMWEKIVLNLLSNAFKHTFSGGLSVVLRPLGDRVELAVSDSGVGIAAAELPRIFERFHRVKGAPSRSHEGTGIGLALVKELVGLHGGTVRVESREGAGSTFTVSLPTGRAHLPDDRIGRERGPSSATSNAAAYAEEALHWLPDGVATASPARDEAPPSASPRRRILLADDNSDMRDYVGRLLQDRYDVTSVTDGAAALAAARENPPDLVLSDVMMPGLDGFALIAELRKDPRTRTLPVILLSARAGEESAIEGLNAGADDYVVKPFSARELLARVRTHLEIARLRRSWARELEQANKELEAFSYSVSHDLRAPLRAMDGYSKMLLQDHADRLDGEGKRLLGVVTKSAAAMGALIDALLEFARQGRKPLRASRFEPKALIEDVLQELRGSLSDRQVDIAVAALPGGWGDPALVRQVFANLLSNAIKYTRPREAARIEVGGEPGPRETTYWVRDNGVGFDPTYAHKLFGVFQRLHSKEKFEGTGVGLALVQQVIHRHGGRVWAEAAVDRGAAFFFTLPNAEAASGRP
jgi:signal transduction histidine kinase